MAIVVILSMATGGYSINGYYGYSINDYCAYSINGYVGYFINGYWWLFYQWVLVVILLVVIDGYFINDY